MAFGKHRAPAGHAGLLDCHWSVVMVDPAQWAIEFACLSVISRKTPAHLAYDDAQATVTRILQDPPKWTGGTNYGHAGFPRRVKVTTRIACKGQAGPDL